MAATGTLPVVAVVLLAVLLTGPVQSQDNVPPQTFNCPMADIAGAAVNTASSQQTSVATWSPAVSAFNLLPGNQFSQVANSANLYGRVSGGQYGYGFTTVGFRFIDNAVAPMNSAFCTFFVRVPALNDVSQPTIVNCPTGVTVSVSSTQSQQVATWNEPTANDNNFIVRRSWRSHAPGSLFPVGTTQVRYEFIDPSNVGNPAVCTFTVTVTTQAFGSDGVVPNLVCPNDVTTAANGIASWPTPTATDASGIASLIPSVGSNTFFQEGFTDVTYNAVDGSGNRASCTFVVTRAPPDSYPPVITSCPENIAQTVTTGSSAFVSWGEPSVYDDSGISRLLMQTHSPNTLFPVGTTPVEYRYEDAVGNIARCVFTVTVTAGDNIPPVVTCTDPFSVSIPSGSASTIVNWDLPTISDNSGVIPTLTRIAGSAPGTSFVAGTYTITYRATDQANNFNECSFMFMVNQASGFFLTCSGNLNFAGTGSQTITIEQPSPSGATGGVTYTYNAFSSGMLLTVTNRTITVQVPSSTTVFINALDNGSGLTASCSFTIRVTTQTSGDTTAPTFDNCQSTLFRTLPSGSTTVFVTWETITATDNSGTATVTQTSARGPGQFPVGTHPITYRATDPSNNFVDCIFMVIVTQASTFNIGCPANVNNIGSGTQSIQLGTASPSGNVGTVTYEYRAFTPTGQSITVQQNNLISVGSPSLTTIVITGTDSVTSNTASCSYTVEVTVAGDIIPPQLSCPAVFDQNTQPNSNRVFVTWQPPTVTDNIQPPPAPVLFPDTQQGPNNFFTIGNYQITYRATDAAGNFGECIVSFNIIDNVDPVFAICPPDIVRQVTFGQPGLSISWNIPTATDNSQGFVNVEQTSGPSSGTFFTTGAQPTTITYTATDPSNRVATCSFRVSVAQQQDIIPPQLSCPAVFDQNTQPNSNRVFVTWQPPTVTDNIQPPPAPVLFPDTQQGPNNFFTIGNYQITYRATDAAGNFGECIVSFNIIDNVDPVFAICPPDIVRQVTFGQPGLSISWNIPTATDNSQGFVNVEQTSGPSSGTFFTTGAQPTTITYTATDPSNRVATCSFRVSVAQQQDIIPPQLSCPAVFDQNTQPNSNRVFVTWQPPTVTDNIQPPPAPVLFPDTQQGPNNFFTIGNYQITYRATDAAGNFGECIVSFNIIDNVDPVFVFCPPDIVREVPFGQPGLSITWTIPTATDNSQGFVNVEQTSGPSSGTFFTTGAQPTTITYTATDPSNRVATCSFTVSITQQDNIPPQLSCPVVFDQNTQPNSNRVFVTWQPPTVTDNIQPPPAPVLFPDTQQGPNNFFTIGNYQITYRATDGAGNFGECIVSFNIIDNVDPVFVFCPPDIVRQVPFGQPGLSITWTIPTATDNSQGFVNVDRTSGPSSGTFFTAGAQPTTITYTATDPSNREATCSFTVSITQQQDNIPPQLSCPVVFDQNTQPNSNRVFVTWQPPTVTDNIQPPPAPVLFPDTQQGPNNFFTIGNYQITYRATDGAGNFGECTVSFNIIDNVDPVFVFCPPDIVRQVPFGQPGLSITWTIPTATDNSQGFVNVDRTSGPSSGTFFTAGAQPTTILYTATDPSNREATCSFTVSITQQQDNIPPQLSCPVVFDQNTQPNSNRVFVTWQPPTVTDNIQPPPAPVLFPDTQQGPNNFFTIGNYQITYRATDGAGNFGECTVSFNIIDNVDPVFVFCPPDIVREVPFGQPGLSITWTIPTATDNSQGFVNVDRTSGPSSGTFFTAGAQPTTILYTATDPSNREATCSFTVSITQQQDNIPPQLSCPVVFDQNTQPNSNRVFVTWQPPTVTDNIQPPPAPVLFPDTQQGPNNFFTIGNYQITYRATDGAGNFGECTVSFNIIDNVDPVFVFCPPDIVREVPFGQPGLSITWTIPTATDNSQGFVNVDRTSGPSSGTFFTAGAQPTTILYTATDPSNREATCSFTVSITQQQDNIPPQLSCPVVLDQNTQSNSNRVFVTWQPPTVTDNIQPPPAPVLFPDTQQGPNNFFTIGNYQITYRATDGAGNFGECTVSFNIIDRILPVFRPCQSDIIRTVDFPDNQVVVAFSDPTADDNSQGNVIVTRTVGPASGTSFVVDTVTEITYTARDPSNNIATCTFNIRINRAADIEPPVFNCPTDGYTGVIPIGSVDVAVTWPTPTATDNSGQVPNVVLQDGSSGPGRFIAGVHPITYVATDGSNLQSLCTFDVVVTDQVDTVPPTVTSCPNNLVATVQLGTGESASVTYSTPTGVDNSNQEVSIVRVRGPASNTPLTVGTYDVRYQLSDTSNNVALCDFCIVISTVDTIDPTITCPSDITQTVELGTSSGTTVSWPPITAIDSSGGAVIIELQTNRPPGGFFPAGVTETVLYRATDVSGNFATCSFTVTINAVDTQPPVITRCPSNILYRVLEFSPNGVPVTWAPPQFFDASGSARIVSQSHQPGDLFTESSTQVVYRIVDTANLEAQCTFQVTIIVQNSCSIIPCANGGNCVPTGFGSNEYNCVCPPCFTGPNCQNPVNPCVNNMCAAGSACVPEPGSCVLYTCQCNACSYGRFCDQQADACANHKCANGAACSAAGGGCLQYSCACTGCFQGSSCDQAYNPCLNPNPCQNGGFCTALQNTCTGFSCQCSGCFTGYRCERPIESPCLENPCQNGACRQRQGSCYDYECDCIPGFSGLHCQVSVVRSNPCNSFPCLNNAECINMDGGNDYTCKCQPGYTGINCGIQTNTPGALSACVSGPCQSGSTCRNSYHSASPAIYQAQYVCICSFAFTGPNCNTPTVNTPSMNTCGNLARPCSNSGTCNNVYNSYLQAIDYWCMCRPGFIGQNCEITVANPCDTSPCLNGGGCSANGNFFTCSCPPNVSGTVCENTIGDVTPPNVFGCPPDISFNAGSQVSVTVPWIEPTSPDGMLVYQTHSPNSSPFQTGTSTRVIYKYADAAGNLAACSFNVLITGTAAGDNTDPIIVCPSDVSVNLAGDVSSVRVVWSPPTASDNQGQPQVVSDRPSGSLFGEGTTPVVYTATDAAGNTATCTFQVIVTRSPGFTIQCPVDVNLPVASDVDCYTYSLPDPTFSNPSGAPILAYRLVNGAATGREFYTTVPFSGSFMYRAVDALGMAAECTFRLTITPDASVPCSSGPCQNGGGCTNFGSGFTCQCINGYTGITCNIPPIGACSSGPCQNGGGCNNVGSGFFCQCINGYTGITCNIPPIGACSSGPCQNGGGCNNVGSGFFCQCINGYTGITCNIPPTGACSSGPCQNGGGCNNVGSGFTCQCINGYTGITCNIPPDFALICTDPLPATGTPGSTIPVNIQMPQVIGANASSVDIFYFEGSLRVTNPYSAVVPASGTDTRTIIIYGVFGQRSTSCTVTITVSSGVGTCSNNPCLNGGTCSPTGNTFSCLCPTGFSGNNCQLGPCSSAPCQNGGGCSVVGSTFTCRCVNGYTGNTCNVPPGGFALMCTDPLPATGTPGSTIPVNIQMPQVIGADASSVGIFYFEGSLRVTNPYSAVVPASGTDTRTITIYGVLGQQSTSCTVTITVSPGTGFQISCVSEVQASGPAGTSVFVPIPQPTVTTGVSNVVFTYFNRFNQQFQGNYNTIVPASGTVTENIRVQATAPNGATDECTIPVRISVVVGFQISCVSEVQASGPAGTSVFVPIPQPTVTTGVSNVVFTYSNRFNQQFQGNYNTIVPASGTVTENIRVRATAPNGATDECTIPVRISVVVGFQISCVSEVQASGPAGTSVFVPIPQPTVTTGVSNVVFTYFNRFNQQFQGNYNTIVPASGTVTENIRVRATAPNGATDECTIPVRISVVVGFQISCVSEVQASGPAGTSVFVPIPQPTVTTGVSNVVFTYFNRFNQQFQGNYNTIVPASGTVTENIRVRATAPNGATDECTIPVRISVVVGFQISCVSEVQASGPAGTSVFVPIPQPTVTTGVSNVVFTYFNRFNQQFQGNYNTIVPASGTVTENIRVRATAPNGATDECTIPVRISVSSSCSPNPCQNGGTCSLSNNLDGFICTCPMDMFVGDLCQFVNPCLTPNICPPGQECFYRNNISMCFLIGRRRRDTHEIDVTRAPCSINTCPNNRTCVSVKAEGVEFIRCVEDIDSEVGKHHPQGPKNHNDDWMQHALAQWSRENIGMHWTMVAVIGVLALVVMGMAYSFMRLMPRKKCQDDIKLIH